MWVEVGEGGWVGVGGFGCVVFGGWVWWVGE